MLAQLKAHLRSKTGVVGVITAGLALLVRIPDCPKRRSPSVNKLAYRTIGITVITVDLAMKAWAAYVAAGHATPPQEARVRALYERYQDVMRTIGMAVRAFLKTSTPPGLATATSAAGRSG